LAKKTFIENNHEIENLNPQAAMGKDYEVIFNFLFASKSVIKSKHKSLLKEQMRYGYFLHQFNQLHCNEYLWERRSSTIQTIIAENIGISMSYSNKLKWIGILEAKLDLLSLPLFN
jgi:hypothetical protein